jgi:hypothetical protein
MRSLLIVTIAAGTIVSLADCSWSNRPDCIFGFRSDGCAPGTAGYQQAQQAQMQATAIAANDDARCQSFGFQPASDGYAQCRMNMDNQRHAEDMQLRGMAIQTLLNR